MRRDAVRLVALNQMSTQALEDHEAWLAQTFHALRLAASPRSCRTDERMGCMALSLGLVGHALGRDIARCRDWLQQAASLLARALSTRASPEDGDRRNPHEAELFLAVVGGFGSHDDRLRCAPLSDDQWRWPRYAAHEALAQYLKQLLALFGGGTASPEALHDVAERCDAVAATREDRRVLRPSLAAITAVLARDVHTLDMAVARLVAAHADEAFGGDGRYRAEGLVCLRAMMWVRLGAERGMPCHVHADHLPLELLRGT